MATEVLVVNILSDFFTAEIAENAEGIFFRARWTASVQKAVATCVEAGYSHCIGAMDDAAYAQCPYRSLPLPVLKSPYDPRAQVSGFTIKILCDPGDLCGEKRCLYRDESIHSHCLGNEYSQSPNRSLPLSVLKLPFYPR